MDQKPKLAQEALVLIAAPLRPLATALGGNRLNIVTWLSCPLGEGEQDTATYDLQVWKGREHLFTCNAKGLTIEELATAFTRQLEAQLVLSEMATINALAGAVQL